MTAGFAAVLARYEPVIGLEVHAQLAHAHQALLRLREPLRRAARTRSSARCASACRGRCRCSTGHAVTLALRAALALGCRVHDISVFERKNYFYPDLPKGYQISQYERPLATHGSLEIAAADGARAACASRAMHMEEDAGKLLHEGFAWSGEKSGVDLNRAGVPLIEIVSEPDLRAPRGGARVPDGAARRAALRRRSRTATWRRARCAATPTSRCARGGSRRSARAPRSRTSTPSATSRARSSTRSRGRSRSSSPAARSSRRRGCGTPSAARRRPMRSKEDAHDYRYFPEPDLPPLVGRRRSGSRRLARSLPELPAARRAALRRAEYALPGVRRGRPDAGARASPTTSRRPRGRAATPRRPRTG